MNTEIKYTNEQIRAYIAIIAKCRNLRGWDLFVNERVRIVKNHIAYLQEFVSKSKSDKARAYQLAIIAALQSDLDTALAQRAQNK